MKYVVEVNERFVELYPNDLNNKINLIQVSETAIIIHTSTGVKKFAYKDLLVMHKALTKIFGKHKKK